MDVLLTNDADYLVCALYAGFLDKCRDGMLKGDARHFGPYTLIQSTYMPQWLPDDVDDAIRSLDNKDMLEVLYGDDHACETCLTDTAIIYMESRFGRKMDKILDRMTKIRELLF